jgi:uncharacterized delta-60 repeat protein
MLNTAFAQLTVIDTNFQIGSAANGTVNKIDIQKTGKIILSGDFQSFKGTSHKRIVRLLPDGSIDGSFLTGTGSEGPIRATALQADDKLIIGGLFNFYNSKAIKNIARLNADGTLDSTFTTGSGANNEITEIFIQKDGKIIISGFFSKYNNINFTGFARLNTNGIIDTNFNIGIGTNSAPECFAQQSNGKLLVGGSFLRYKGLNISKLIRLDLDGNLDTTFNAGNIAGTVNEVFVLPDNKIIISGSFTAINGMMANRMARLFSDGSLDTSFFANVSARIRDMHLQKDGKIIISGDFTMVNGQNVQRIARLNKNGSLDNSVYVGTNGSVNDIAEQNDKNILIGGGFTQLTQNVAPSTKSINRVARIENYYSVSQPCVPATAPILDTTVSNIVCTNQALTITVVGGSLNAGSNWFWYKDSLNGTYVDSGFSIIVSESKSTDFYVTAGLTCSDTVPKFAVFKLLVSDSINTELGFDVNGMYALDTSCTYQWHYCDSTLIPIQGETSQWFLPKTSGKYMLELTNKDGCKALSECMNYTVSIQSVYRTKSLNIQNPVSNFIRIPVQYQLSELEIYSTLGQKVYSGNKDLSVIDVSALKSGVYYLRAKDQQNTIYSEKLMILN